MSKTVLWSSFVNQNRSNSQLLYRARDLDRRAGRGFESSAGTHSPQGADLLSASGGGLAPAQPNDTMHEAGAWIAVSTPQVTIPAHSQFTDKFVLTLPLAVSPGEHPGAVVAAAIVGTSPQGSTIEARTALIAMITVPGAFKPSASLSALSKSTAGPQQLGFEIALSNTGNLLLTYAGSVEIFDSDGHKVASLPLTPPDAYVVPAGQVALAALWNESLPQSGNYTARETGQARGGVRQPA